MSDNEKEIKQLASEIKVAFKKYPDFPKPGILFEDFLPIFADPAMFSKLIKAFTLQLEGKKIDYIVGLESRGFLFAPTLALQLNVGFVPVRKPNKLPGKTLKIEYEKEYSTDVFELQEDAIPKGSNVVVVDDILATGGSAEAAGKLVGLTGSKVIEYVFVMELNFLKGSEKLNAPCFALFDGQ